MIDSFLLDLRYSLRGLVRSPRFTLAALCTLALGIGANAAIYSVVNTVLLRPLPYKDAGRLTMIRGFTRGDTQPSAPSDFNAWRSDGRFFEQMAASRDASYSLTGAGDPESIIGYRFSADFFPLMGVAPALGRTFLPEEDRPGNDKVVVLSHPLWQRRFGGDPGILGTSITLNGQPYTVIGVMPATFRHPQRTDLWTPLAMDPALNDSRTARFLRVVARLKPGVTIEQAQAGLDELMRRRETEFPDTNTGLGARVASLRDNIVGDIKPALLTLSGAAGFVLLMVCANVAHLALARSTGRTRELALRTALGAGPGRLIRQMLTESLLLSAAGGTLGLVLAFWCTGALLAIFPNHISNLSIPVVTEIPIDANVIGFTLIVTLVSALLFGLVPALKATRQAQVGSLREGPKGATGGSAGPRVRWLLIVAETATAMVLLVGAALMLRSFVQLQRSDMGMRTDGVMSGQVFLSATRYPDTASLRKFTDAVLERLERTPGVESAGATNYLPLSGYWGTRSFTLEGEPPPRPGQEPEADDRVASPGYFRTLGIPLLRGRSFTAQDLETTPLVAMINETAARRYWPGQDPIGRRIDIGRESTPVLCEIVGVVGDVKAFGQDQETHADLYRPLAQGPYPLLAFAVRTSQDPLSLAPALRRAVWDVDGQQPLFKVLPMSQLAAESLALRRVTMLLLATFAVLATVLAAVGIYGVISFMVSQRTNEIGVRIALGATPGGVARMLVGQGLRPAVTGLAIGLLASLGLARLVASLFHGMSLTDPLTYTGAAVVLMGVAGAACYLPARRAVRADPMLSLRQE